MTSPASVTFVTTSTTQTTTAPASEAHWLSVASAAVYLDSTPSAVRTAYKRGQLPFVKTPLGQIRFDREALDAWIVGGDGA